MALNASGAGARKRSMGWNCTKLPNVGPAPAGCALAADGCMCSQGCPSTYACQPSPLCSSPRADNLSSAPRDVPIVLFLNFNRSHVRTKYKRMPDLAYARELGRILWFVESARRVGTRLPLYVAVSGDRNASAEALLRARGVGIVQNDFVPAPRWASTFHHFSFTRLAALSLTQFRKVIVMDNDMALLGNIDDLASDGARAPGMVWHTATVLPRKEHCAVTGGMHHLHHELNIRQTPDRAGRGLNHGVRCYDGSDQEFWRSFYRPIYELPLRYHAHQNLQMSITEWQKIRVIHSISGFRARNRAPSFVRQAMRYFDKPSKGWTKSYGR